MIRGGLSRLRVGGSVPPARCGFGLISRPGGARRFDAVGSRRERMSLRKALLAATALALPVAAAQAQPVTGLYVGAGAGVNFRHDSDDRGIEVVSKVGAVGLGA